MGERGRAGISKNVTHAGSKLTSEMGEGGRAGISKNVTHAGSQLTSEMGEGGGIDSQLPSLISLFIFV